MNMISNPTADLQTTYRTALAARAAALQDIPVAEAALRRGTDELTAAKAALGKFDNLAHAIARHRADAVKAGKPASAALAPGLLEDQKKQREAADYVQELEAAQALLQGEVEAARSKHQAAHQAVVNSAKHLMAREFETKGARLIELEAELIPLWRDIWAFLNSFTASVAGPVRPNDMPCKNMDNILQVAAKYAKIMEDEAGNMKNVRLAVFPAQLQSLIKGEPSEKPGDSLAKLAS